MSCWIAALSRRMNAPSSRFSSIVITGKMCRPSGEWARPCSTIECAGMPLIRLPMNRISPETGCNNPEIVRNVVVLPAPLTPISETTSPSSTTRSMPLTASIFP
jgi:hypothetical protein